MGHRELLVGLLSAFQRDSSGNLTNQLPDVQRGIQQQPALRGEGSEWYWERQRETLGMPGMQRGRQRSHTSTSAGGEARTGAGVVLLGDPSGTHFFFVVLERSVSRCEPTGLFEIWRGSQHWHGSLSV